MISLTRRQFLRGALIVVAAPAIVRADALMRIVDHDALLLRANTRRAELLLAQCRYEVQPVVQAFRFAPVPNGWVMHGAEREVYARVTIDRPSKHWRVQVRGA